MLHPDALAAFAAAQKQLVVATYNEAWRHGVGNYRAPDRPYDAQAESSAQRDEATLTGAALLAARRKRQYVAPSLPDQYRRAIAVAPALNGVNDMVVELSTLAPTQEQLDAAGGDARAAYGNAMGDWAESNAWRLNGGESAAWAGEQAGYGEAADADGDLLDWEDEGDDRVCDSCSALGSMGPMPLSEWPTTPGAGDTDCSVGCFAPGIFAQGSFDGGLRAWYTGNLIQVETLAGHRLTVTPNHPVATPEGFVAAQELHEGTYLLSHAARVERSLLAGGINRPTDHVQNRPARIEQVFHALALALPVRSTASRPEYLHGDARSVKGQIDVVSAHRTLRRDANAVCLECGRERRFVGALMRSRSFPALRGTQPMGLGFDGTALSLPRGSALSFDSSPVRLERRPFQGFGLGSASKVDAALREPAGQSRAADGEFLAELEDRFPSFVAPDKIVSVRLIRDFAGHVFDLQSPHGWIVAAATNHSGGILASNCRCSLESVGAFLAGDTYQPQPLDDSQQSAVGQILDSRATALNGLMPDLALLG